METAERLQQIIRKHNEIISLVLKLKKENKMKDEQIAELQIKNNEFAHALQMMYKHHAKKLLYGNKRHIKTSSG